MNARHIRSVLEHYLVFRKFSDLDPAL